MKKEISLIAFDLGASSGRLMLGGFDGETIRLSEIHRFQNEPVWMNGRFYWDIYRLFHEMKQGLKKLKAKGVEAKSVGVDTWGVDYGLLDKCGNLIGAPLNYRDSRTEHSVGQVGRIMPLEEIYNRTGIQVMDINTIFQLHSDKSIRPDILENADKLLMMPDLLGYFLTGEKYNEYTIMSTSQLLNAREKGLDRDILRSMGIREDLFSSMLRPGTPVGSLSAETMEETGLGHVQLVAVGSHDTASAVAGTPFEDADAAFLSCGTWSLLGMEVDQPIISPESYQYNFTNEGGVEDTIRFLKNINGLWIIQQLRKSYGEQVAPVDFAQIVQAAEKAAECGLRIDPGDRIFTAPHNMMEAIREYCVRTGQREPKDLGEMAMAVYNGLTSEYKTNVEALEKLTGRTVRSINMIGGGIQDELLCRLTAKVTGKRIVTGPVEASVLGNVVMQLKALGEIETLEEGRAIIRQSFEQKIYE